MVKLVSLPKETFTKQIIKKASKRKLLKLAEFRLGLAHWQ